MSLLIFSFAVFSSHLFQVYISTQETGTLESGTKINLLEVLSGSSNVSGEMELFTFLVKTLYQDFDRILEGFDP